MGRRAKVIRFKLVYIGIPLIATQIRDLYCQNFLITNSAFEGLYELASWSNSPLQVDFSYIDLFSGSIRSFKCRRHQIGTKVKRFCSIGPIQNLHKMFFLCQRISTNPSQKCWSYLTLYLCSLLPTISCLTYIIICRCQSPSLTLSLSLTQKALSLSIWNSHRASIMSFWEKRCIINRKNAEKLFRNKTDKKDFAHKIVVYHLPLSSSLASLV